MSDISSFLARRILADLGAHGGQLQRQPDERDGLPRVLLGFSDTADRDRCRAILADAKADPAVWRALLRALPAGAPQ